MGRAQSLAEIQAIALRVEDDMRVESTEWLGAVQLHDLELGP
jgi:hypothetical protein